jgi:hypothetical protein
MVKFCGRAFAIAGSVDLVVAVIVIVVAVASCALLLVRGNVTIIRS